MTASLPAIVARRLLGSLVVVVVVTALAWWMLHVLRPELFPEQPAWPRQWRDFLVRAFLHFDFGRSRQIGTPDVADVIREGAPADAALFCGGLVVGLTGGLIGGAYAARHGRGRRAIALQAAAMVAFCAPVYVVGLGLLLLFGSDIGMVHTPVGVPLKYVPFEEGPGRWLGSLVVPWLVLGAPLAGLVARVMYGQTREALTEDPVRTARAKGASPRRALLVHAGPLGVAPALAVVSASANLLLTNMVLAEHVFSVPGIFQRLPTAVGSADVPLMLGFTAAGAAFVALTSLVLDVALLLLDPRIRR